MRGLQSCCRRRLEPRKAFSIVHAQRRPGCKARLSEFVRSLRLSREQGASAMLAYAYL